MRKPPKPDREAQRQAQADRLAEAIRSGDLFGAADLLKQQTKDKSLAGPADRSDDAPAGGPGCGRADGADGQVASGAAEGRPLDERHDDTDGPPIGDEDRTGNLSRTGGETSAGDARPDLPAGLGGQEVLVRSFEATVRVYQVRTPLADLAGGGAIAGELDGVLRGARQRFDELDASPGLCHAADARADEVLLARPEACPVHVEGNEAIALLGLLYRGADGWVVEQSVARSPLDEAGVMLAFAARRDAARVIVTYPGQASTLKLLRKRCETCDVETPDRWPAHLDLRKEARRVWQRRLPNYRLGTLQQMLLARPIGQPMSANQIRGALRRLLLVRDAAAIGRVLEQNRRELTATARILCLLLTGCDPLP